jgi:imidazolonepropionase-like amidohydrolase
VRERADRGVDVIKMMATGGGITSGSQMWDQQFGLDELRAAVEEAHRAGLPITAHAHSPEGIADAVEAGFDGIEHCTFFGAEGIDVDPSLVRRIAEAGTVVTLTLGAVPGTPLTDEQKKHIPAFIAGLAALREAGVTLLCGSDSGIFAAKPHGAYVNSVEAMVTMAGLSPVEALRSATSLPAKALGLGDRKGRIAPGYDADLIAVGNDPVRDIGTLRDVRTVFHAGIPVG